ncbi:hypothetical protein BGZ92_000108 [Podila epicladia]|nr:hypothetical protein BGZ92_000108 [Podila epicladia]
MAAFRAMLRPGSSSTFSSGQLHPYATSPSQQQQQQQQQQQNGRNSHESTAPYTQSTASSASSAYNFAPNTTPSNQPAKKQFQNLGLHSGAASGNLARAAQEAKG